MIDFNISKQVIPPKAREIKNVKIGDKIKARESEWIGNQNIVEFTIVAVYPYHVRAVSEKETRCFTLGDLVKEGLEPCGARAIDAKMALVIDYD